MASPEAAPVSYLRAIREIRPDEMLEDFLGVAAKDARNAFGIKRAKMVKRSVSLHQELQPGYQPVYDGIDIPSVHTFAANALWVTLFEKRAVASDEINDLLGDSHRRLTARKIRGSRGHRTPTGQRRDTYRENTLPKELSDIEKTATLKPKDYAIRVTEVVDSLRIVDNVVEYCLALDAEAPMASVILAQSAKIDEHAHNAVASRDLFKVGLGFEPTRDPLLVPFMRVPNGSPEQHEMFLENIQDKRPPSLQVSHIEWDIKLRSVA